jgi:hypothetical protein
MLKVVEESYVAGRLTVVVPWLVEYLAQMDAAAPLLPAFRAVCLRYQHMQSLIYLRRVIPMGSFFYVMYVTVLLSILLFFISFSFF